MLPQSWTEVMSTPWTLLTYMFAHFDFLHILGNMLCLYCFGIVALDLMTQRRFVATYIAGGLAGAAAFLFAAEFVPSPGLIGSSAAVMAVAAAAVLTKPDYHVRLWLFGLVKIKWIALFYVAFALLATRADASAVCAHAAHLGGILAGAVVALDCRKKIFARRRKAIVLLNKSDLTAVIEKEEMEQKTGAPVISISAREETGMEELEEQMKKMFFQGEISFNDEVYITNARHKQALLEAKKSLELTAGSIEMGMPEDFFSIDLMNAYEELGSIIGEAVGEDLVNEIFSKFCTGK